jgi:hypothetical protein
LPLIAALISAEKTQTIPICENQREICVICVLFFPPVYNDVER